ncbi:S-ribosylhomocysteine lyase [Desulfogranum mediterraneum]|uniref:S-ribosylhomocysteine lyase n=1 Tax=Desulfogranum mediterraneum TaxID=160661 RepID=UPI000416E008|nr:S-ribosylhomocysteine lyase [Desulfogranum mediterraneum]
MRKIESFKIDHTRLQRGLYVSRKDPVGATTVTTFDLRLKEPDREAALDPAAAHTIEHLGATFLRNHPQFGPRILYFGPMGCLTGFYLLISDNLEAAALLPLIQELFCYMADFTGAIPGASAVECGNHSLMDLAAARLEAGRYLKEVLSGSRGPCLSYPE